MSLQQEVESVLDTFFPTGIATSRVNLAIERGDAVLIASTPPVPLSASDSED